MKIILCIFLLNITAVSVFGQSVELNGILGESVKFPAAVKKGGYLMYGGVSIGDSSLEPPGIGKEKYSGRVQWDSCTGLFSLSGLKMEDIGGYEVQNTDKNITVFQLNVYKDNINVSKPHVSITQNEYPCTIECTAERGTEATLSWYREGQTKPYSRSSVRSAPHLDLPQTVERSGTYTCEAKNSVSNEKASITVGDHCTAPTSSSTIVVSVIAAVALLIVFGVLCYCFIRRRRGFIRRRRAVRTLIQVKKLLDNVDLHAYDETVPPDDETVPPDALRSLIQAKMLLVHVDPQENDFIRRCLGIRRGISAVGALIHAKMLLNDVYPQENAKMLLDHVDPQENGETIPLDAVRTLIQVKKILDNVDPHEYGIRRGISAVGALIHAKMLLDDVDPQENGETIPLDAVRTLIQVKKILDNVDPHEYAFEGRRKEYIISNSPSSDRMCFPIGHLDFEGRRKEYIISNSPSSDRMCFPIGHLDFEGRRKAFEGRPKGDILQAIPKSAFEGRRKGDAVQPVPQSGDAVQPVPQSGDILQAVPKSD